MILLVTNEDYPVIVLTLQRYKIIWENASEIRFLTSINTFVKIINTFFLVWVGDYTLSFYRNLPNGDSPLFDIAKVRNKIEKSKRSPDFNIPLTFSFVLVCFIVYLPCNRVYYCRRCVILNAEETCRRRPKCAGLLVCWCVCRIGCKKTYRHKFIVTIGNHLILLFINL